MSLQPCQLSHDSDCRSKHDSFSGSLHQVHAVHPSVALHDPRKYINTFEGAGAGLGGWSFRVNGRNRTVYLGALGSRRAWTSVRIVGLASGSEITPWI